MGRKRKAKPKAQPVRKRNWSRWRAATLASVYLLFALHIAHWKIAGKTLAPLELNEVMYTFELGIVTAGFLFMAAAVISVALFGRFFCSWGCHILALEDLCAWLLAKVGIHPRPIRSRFLLLVPPTAMLYMFVWPQVQRVMRGEALPRLRLATDAEGWASFVTTDFMRNLPGPWVSALTFAVCGFLIVYVLGSRSFCRYACPYGAVFALVDRVSPGQIVTKGGCVECGRCTAACSSGIRVHEELKRFGKVVDTNCLKDLDCVSACENDAVGFGFARPSFFRSWSRRARDLRRYDFSIAEDLLMVATFLAVLLVFRGLYASVPFLMTLGIGGILAYVAVVALRLGRTDTVSLNKLRLKRAGHLTPAGSFFSVGASVLLLFVGHSAFIRYHEFRGHGAHDRVLLAAKTGTLDRARGSLGQAVDHLELCARWGLYRPPELDRRLATLHLLADRPSAAEPYLERIRNDDPASAHELRADVLASRGELEGAETEYRFALVEDPDRLNARLSLAEILAHAGDYPGAVEHLVAAVAIRPDSAKSHYNLAVLLAQLGRVAESIEHYETAARLAPGDPEVQNNLGFMLAAEGREAEAERCFRRAIELDPDYPHSHFNLGRLLLSKGRTFEAESELRRAAELEPAYARILDEATR